MVLCKLYQQKQKRKLVNLWVVAIADSKQVFQIAWLDIHSTGSDHGSGLGLYRIRTQEVTYRGEWGWDYLEGWAGPGPCPVFFNVRMFDISSNYTYLLHTGPFFSM